MSSLLQLRLAAREIFDETLRAVDAGEAVRRAVSFDGAHLRICNCEIDLNARPIYYVAIGKAAMSMGVALEDLLGDRFAQGLIAGGAGRRIPNRGNTASLRKRRWYSGGHPLPNKRTLMAGSYALELLARANQEKAGVIFLISGGGSAMFEWPANEHITLANLRVANKVLVNCGASISEINSVRRAFSAVKGGKLAARASSCDQVTLIISDVPSGQEYNVASGPTLAPPTDAPDPKGVIARYNLKTSLPPQIIAAVDTAEALPAAPQSEPKHFVLLNNDDALKAAAQAAQARGFLAEIASDISDQPITNGCTQLWKRLTELAADHRSGYETCLISGGEFACPVVGNGLGGRNLETALRLALASSTSPKNEFVALCAGTDGVDGNSPAAGAMVDHTTIERAQAKGLEPEDFLARSDSYSFLSRSET